MDKASFGVATILLLFLLLKPESAMPHDGPSGLADELIACATLENVEERLACYDLLAEPLVGLKLDEPNDSQDALFTFSGKGDSDTDSFVLTEPWRIVWQVDTGILTIELRDTRDNLIGTIGFQIGSGGGRSEVQPPGSYKLAMRASGNWRVSIIPAE